MSTPLIKMKNAETVFKSRIPVASRPRRPVSSRPRIGGAPGEAPVGMRSKIPVLKNKVKQPSQCSVIHSGKLPITSAGDQGHLTSGSTAPDSHKRSQDTGKHRSRIEKHTIPCDRIR